MTKHSLSITLFLLLFFCGTLHAQLKLGVEAGPDFSRLLNILQGFNGNGQPVSQNSQAVTRFYGGLFLDIPLDKNDQFILQPSLRYRGAGGETPQIIDYNGNRLADKTKYRFNYVDLPVQLLYSPSLSFGKPWIGGGFYSGILVNASTKAGSDAAQSLTIGSASNDDVKRFDFGFNATIGLTLKCGVLIGGDFQQSLGNLTPTSSGSNSASKVRNTMWGIHVGYTWSLNGKASPKN